MNINKILQGNYLVTKLTPEQYSQALKQYWFSIWTNGKHRLEAYHGNSAFEALMIAKDDNEHVDDLVIELIDWNTNTIN